jgi:hypothetical protein
MNIINRIQAPTPKFFRKVRTIGLVLAAVSATLLASPIALPALVIQVAGYLAVAGSVATAVAQTATENEQGKVRGDTSHDNSEPPVNKAYYGYEHKP